MRDVRAEDIDLFLTWGSGLALSELDDSGTPVGSGVLAGASSVLEDAIDN